ncbi:MAG: LacI family DNA-binding transcriptional regulator, partial [Streptococcus sp.]|nr:LacI family DNA-binding transcriptional regulator [Streptococcus sp.]
VKQYGLKTGDVVECRVRPPHDGEKYFPLTSIDKINGRQPSEVRDRIPFEHLTPLFPEEKFNLNGKPNVMNMSTRIVDLFSPIGKGQRALIVAQPKTGKTILMKDIANALGVSVSTVSLALRDDPRISISVQRRVQAEAKKLGYRISLSGALLSQSKPKIIGVVANFEQELHSAYVKEMQSLATQNGYWMMAENASSYKNPIDALKKLSQFRVETIIAIDPPISLYSNDLKPTVVIAQGCDSPTASLVISDSFQGARDLADHLYSLGHRYVVYLDGPKGVSAEARRKVIRRAMEQKDISLKIWQAGNSLEAGFEATQELLTEIWSGKEGLACKSFGDRRGVLGRTTAIVCYNDQCAEGA